MFTPPTRPRGRRVINSVLKTLSHILIDTVRSRPLARARRPLPRPLLPPALVSRCTRALTRLLSTRLYHRYVTLPASPDRLLSTLQSFKGLTALPNLAAAIASLPLHLRLRQTPPSFPPFRPKVRPCPWQRPPPFPQPPLAKGQAASVEAAIALLKVRWKILRNLNVGLDHAAQTVVACVVLHNMCQFTKGPEDEGGYMWRDSLESPQLASLVDSERSLNYLGESLREALAEDLYEEACLRSKVNNCAANRDIIYRPHC
ncbi:unnamed protein product [Musa acuminata subsp. burmannicoides]